MGKVHLGSNKAKDKVQQSVAVEATVVVQQEPIVQIQERIVEVPVEKIVTVEKPVEVIVEKIVTVEKIIEVPVERIIERTIFVDKPVEVVRELRVHDVEKLLIERERVRLLKKSNAILRIAIVSLFVVGLTAIGVLLG